MSCCWVHHLLSPATTASAAITGSQISLHAQQHYGCTWTIVFHLRGPLCPNVGKRCWSIDSKADKKDVSLRVGERTETIIVFLTSCTWEKERGTNSMGEGEREREREKRILIRWTTSKLTVPKCGGGAQTAKTVIFTIQYSHILTLWYSTHQYPIEKHWLVCHRPWHCCPSCRTLWVRTLGGTSWYSTRSENKIYPQLHRQPRPPSRSASSTNEDIKKKVSSCT